MMYVGAFLGGTSTLEIYCSISICWRQAGGRRQEKAEAMPMDRPASA
jgi:hypothetical protein